MIDLLDVVLALAAGVLLLPTAVFTIECLLAVLPGRPRSATPADAPRPRLAVLMPAHDEALVIGDTLTDLEPHLAEGDRVLVVADNCSDETANIARRHGAEVVERSDAMHRGKGHALEFGLGHLAVDPPEVVIIFDADCHVTAGSLGHLAAEAVATQQPVQAEYLLRPPAEAEPRAVVSALAFLVRNRVRPWGLARIGMPAHLTGSGMAFSWAVLRKAPPTGSHLVEDLVMGLELARLGHPPRLCVDVQVGSVLPQQDEAAVGQRRRWEHGQMDTLLRQAPRLMWQGLTEFRADLLVLGLDLAVPPLALLVSALGAVWALALVVAPFSSGALALRLASWGLAAVTLAVLAAWARHGRDNMPARMLLAVPRYVLWKIPIYVAFLFKRRQATWERTQRDDRRDEDPS